MLEQAPVRHMALWREEHTLEQVCSQDLWCHRGTTLEQLFTEELHLMEKRKTPHWGKMWTPLPEEE